MLMTWQTSEEKEEQTEAARHNGVSFDKVQELCKKKIWKIATLKVQTIFKTIIINICCGWWIFPTVWLLHFHAITLWIFGWWCPRVEVGRKGFDVVGAPTEERTMRLTGPDCTSRTSSASHLMHSHSKSNGSRTLPACLSRESLNLWSRWVNVGLAADSHSGSETTSSEVKLCASARRNSNSCPTHIWCCFVLFSQTHKKQLAKTKESRGREADAVISFVFQHFHFFWIVKWYTEATELDTFSRMFWKPNAF